jgi:hypothetical protein
MANSHLQILLTEGASRFVIIVLRVPIDKAFRGELVPTEAELARREGREYEPASVLLERIKKERASQEKTLASAKRKVRKASVHVD